MLDEVARVLRLQEVLEDLLRLRVQLRLDRLNVQEVSIFTDGVLHAFFFEDLHELVTGELIVVSRRRFATIFLLDDFDARRIRIFLLFLLIFLLFALVFLASLLVLFFLVLFLALLRLLVAGLIPIACLFFLLILALFLGFLELVSLFLVLRLLAQLLLCARRRV